MEDKIREREGLYIQLLEAKNNVFEAEQVFNRTKNLYHEIRTKHETIDREIAMVNRTIVTTKAKQAELTLDQVKAIAERLGIAITEGGE